LPRFSDFFAEFFRGDVFRTLAEFLPMPSFSTRGLWDYCCQEEIRRGKDVDEDEDEENLSLTSKKGTKGKKASVPRGGATGSSKPKKDLSHIKCYVCGELGHYASKCPQAKRGKGTKGKKQQVAASVEEEDQDEEEEEQHSWLLQLASSLGCSKRSTFSFSIQRTNLERGGT
jgi:hypothetical protein